MLEKLWGVGSGRGHLGGYCISPGLDSCGGGRKEKQMCLGILLDGWKRSLLVKGFAECRAQRERNEYNKVLPLATVKL